MNPPMINSTNSVSTTRRKREAERSINWTAEETQVLLCAWSDERVQKSLAENLRNRHVFKHLSTRMSEMGFSRSPHQCRLRVKTLKANYVRAKLQRNVNSLQPCTFKYFAEMDAVLGRRSGEGVDRPFFVSSEHQMSECHLDSFDRTGRLSQDLNSNTDNGGHHFSTLERTGRRWGSLERRGSRQCWQLDSEVKLEEREDSQDEFELIADGFPPCPRNRCHEAYSRSDAHCEMSGTLVDHGLSRSSPHIAPPPPSPPLVQSAASPLPTPPDPSPDTHPTSDHHHLQSAGLQPTLKHLLESCQQLMSETRGLLVQMESQRQEQARWHQDLLAQWLQREERRQRETAEREERREKARMEHEIRVLELLTVLARDHGCKCGGSQTESESPIGPSHTTDKDRS